MKKSVIGLGALAVIIGLGSYYYLQASSEKKIVVIVPSYKNQAYCRKNLESVFMQKNGSKPYGNWSLIYTDDCSPDGTYDEVMQCVKDHHQEQHCAVIRNPARRGSLANIYSMVHQCSDDAIVVALDGDDWLAHDRVFEKLNEVYHNSNVWLTYGQYQEYPSGKLGICQALPVQVTYNSLYRLYPFTTSHLRTFYAGLFKQIKKEDLQYNGEFFSITGDLAFMFPMLEMAGEHVRFIPDVLYVYNMDNPINDWKKDIQLLLRMERVIRGKTRYARLGRHPQQGAVA